MILQTVIYLHGKKRGGTAFLGSSFGPGFTIGLFIVDWVKMWAAF